MLVTFAGPAYFNYNIAAAFPPPGQGGVITWNHTVGQGEVDFWNGYASAGISFNFYQQTSASAATLLAPVRRPTIATFNTQMTVNGYVQVGNSTTAQGLGVYGFLNVTTYANIDGGATITGGLTTDIAVVNNWSAVNGASGTNRIQYFQTAGVSRWGIGGSSAPESGSGNTGTEFQIARYSDAGAYLDSPLSISRSNGQVSIYSGGLAVAGFISTNNNLYVNGVNTANRNIVWQTSGVGRWTAMATGDAESGTGNTGSNFALYRMTDAGGFLDSPLYITRSTGQVQIGGGGLLVNGQTNFNGVTYLSQAFGVTCACKERMRHSACHDPQFGSPVSGFQCASQQIISAAGRRSRRVGRVPIS